MGNSADLGDTDEREVTKEQGVELMNELQLDHHIETSALTGQNIDTLFEYITKHLYLYNQNKLADFKDEPNFQDQYKRGNSFKLN